MSKYQAKNIHLYWITGEKWQKYFHTKLILELWSLYQELCQWPDLFMRILKYVRILALTFTSLTIKSRFANAGEFIHSIGTRQGSFILTWWRCTFIDICEIVKILQGTQWWSQYFPEEGFSSREVGCTNLLFCNIFVENYMKMNWYRRGSSLFIGDPEFATERAPTLLDKE